MAVHKANEYDDNHGPGKSSSWRLDQKAHRFQIFTPGYMLATKGASEQNKVFCALWEAARGEASFFRGDYTLLANMTEDDIANGWKMELGPGQNQLSSRLLTEVELNPREAFEWFAATSTYEDLLPESLRVWLDNRSVKKETVTVEKEPPVKEGGTTAAQETSGKRILVGKERGLWREAERHPKLTVPQIVDLFLKNSPLVHDENGRTLRGFTKENLEKTLRRLRKSAK